MVAFSTKKNSKERSSQILIGAQVKHKQTPELWGMKNVKIIFTRCCLNGAGYHTTIINTKLPITVEKKEFAYWLLEIGTTKRVKVNLRIPNN